MERKQQQETADFKVTRQTWKKYEGKKKEEKQGADTDRRQKAEFRVNSWTAIL